ncbi:hypothetical protein O181_075012 [Austropuccinia psidii MF-1]|uniref:Uncharacterized protein n=1 Tax=Austropuccinia psidii MF-1 TaxID=1389203 RepID=A0A9Q3FBX5_9BASI|nr:hypothetical protein [Austropuccinia psidii MF-1]
MRGVQQWTNTNSSWANTGGPIPPPRQPQNDEIDGEELEITTPIQKRRIQSTSLSPVPDSTTIHEVIRSPQPPQPPIRSPTKPSTLASTSTNIQPPMARTSRNPISPEPVSIFDNHQFWNITGTFTDKKVVTSVFAEVDALTEVFVDKAMNSAVPGESTRALARGNFLLRCLGF